MAEPEDIKTVYRKSADDEELRKFSPLIHAAGIATPLARLAHDGFVFAATGRINGVVDDANSDLLLRVPAMSPLPHLDRIRLSFSRGDVQILFYEAPTTTDDGLAAAVLNTNRDLLTANQVLLFTGPTVSAIGTLLHTGYAPPTGVGQGNAGAGLGDVDNAEEWVLASNTDYLIRVTNNSGVALDWRYELVWFEPNYPEDATRVVQS